MAYNDRADLEIEGVDRELLFTLWERTSGFEYYIYGDFLAKFKIQTVRYQRVCLVSNEAPKY